jgi:hypothetical protein
LKLKAEYNIIKSVKHYKKRKKIRRGMTIFIIILLPILVSAYVVLLSPLFKIQAVEVSGNKEVKTEEIENNFDYRNILLFTEDKIKGDLLKKFPKISDLEIKKNLIKRTVELTIEERERLGIICRITEQRTPDHTAGQALNNEQSIREEIEGCFYIDKEGFIFEGAPQTSGSLVLLIKDYSQTDFYLGKQVFEQGIVNFISQIKQGLFSETGIKVLDFTIPSFPYKDLKVMTSEGWYIIFDLEGDLKSQFLALKAALEEKIKDRQGLEYMDLRIENRIYYK